MRRRGVPGRRTGTLAVVGEKMSKPNRIGNRARELSKPGMGHRWQRPILRGPACMRKMKSRRRHSAGGRRSTRAFRGQFSPSVGWRSADAIPRGKSRPSGGRHAAHDAGTRHEIRVPRAGRRTGHALPGSPGRRRTGPLPRTPGAFTWSRCFLRQCRVIRRSDSTCTCHRHPTRTGPRLGTRRCLAVGFSDSDALRRLVE